MRRNHPIVSRLRVPVVAAPMTNVSNPELVVAACRAGVLGSFPTGNARTAGDLENWLTEIERELAAAQAEGESVAPVVPNLIVHRSNTRLEEDLAILVRHAPAAVITSVGSPTAVIPRLHDAGIEVWSDVANVHHTQRAIEAGVDGLILLTAGSGGNTGSANPFAFIRAARSMFDGLIAVSGGQSDGWALWGAQAMGCDLGYMGTRFLATAEAGAPQERKQMIVDSQLDDLQLVTTATGLQMNLMRLTMAAKGLDPAEYGPSAAQPANGNGVGKTPPPRDIWSAGHSVSGVADIVPVRVVVDRLAAEYAEARAASLAPLIAPAQAAL